MQQRRPFGLGFFGAYALRVAGDDSNVLLFHCALTPTVPAAAVFSRSFFVSPGNLAYFFAYVLGATGDGSHVFKKKNLNAFRPSEHPPVGKISKRLGEIIGCKCKNTSWHLNGFPDGSNIGSTV